MKNKGIYYLLNDDKIVYIGKSLSNMKTRVDSHLKDEAKEFDSVLYHSIDNDSDINILEVAMIAKHSPIYNNDCVTSDNSTIDNLNIEDFTLEKTVITDLEKRVVKNEESGYKMYNDGVIKLFTALTKAEALRAVSFYDSDTIDKFNILNMKFVKYTEDMDKSDRSKFKKKLIENDIMHEFNGKIMLNPYMFLPKGDKNVLNCNYLTQKVWNYLFIDCDSKSDEIEKHVETMFGKNALHSSDYIKVGSKKYGTETYLLKPGAGQ